ncbi:Ankyrin repeat and LEM domain-containing protein [Dirofilaria immitis]
MEQSKQPEEYYAVHIPSPGAGISSEGAVFATLREASSFANIPESKAKGARFKRFQSPDDAKNYAKNGDIFCKSPEISVKNEPTGEPGSSFPSVSRIMFNRLKKSIESKDDELFSDMVLQNPRYLINIGSDTPTIVVEGFRYNAMHLAAKVGNLHVAKYVLHLICDTEALLALYGTSEDDVRMRSRILLDCYLNMPDKGSHDTPLHFASKFGHYHLVELFLSYNICQKNAINKMGFTPAQICCTRYVGRDKEDLHAAIMPLFLSFFVALYRPTDNYYSITIQLLEEIPANTLPVDAIRSPICMSTLEAHELAAYAGPFADKTMAQKFYETWKIEERDSRRSHPRKGAERIGRRLANEYKITWMERWNFCNKLLDFQSYSGLDELNCYLVHIRLNPPISSIRTVSFDDDNDCSIFADASDTLFVEDERNENSAAEVDNSHNSSLSGITSNKATMDANSNQLNRLANLHLDELSSSDLFLDSGDFASRNDAFSTKNPLNSESSGLIVVASDIQHEQISNIDEGRNSIDFDYYTPPCSPEPVYIYEGIPSKDDEELIIALSLVDPQLIQRFGAIAEYMRHVLNVPETERSQWPFTDSPRAKRRRMMYLQFKYVWPGNLGFVRVFSLFEYVLFCNFSVHD